MPNRIDMKESRTHESLLRNSNGFTLIEIIAVLTIIGILGSITVRRAGALETTAVEQSFILVISELNTREALTWSLIKISDTNWVDDLQLFGQVEYDLGSEQTWSSRDPAGGILLFKGQQIVLQRLPSISSRPGTWRR